MAANQEQSDQTDDSTANDQVVDPLDAMDSQNGTTTSLSAYEAEIEALRQNGAFRCAVLMRWEWRGQ